MLTSIYIRLYTYVRGIFDHTPALFTVVRKYQDAHNHYVGELYFYSIMTGKSAYRLIGCSLDSFPVDATLYEDAGARLDLEHDFLYPMAADTLRVGATVPQDNDSVRKMLSRIPRRNIRLVIQNRFIERVLEDKQCPKAADVKE
jgi:hypothetical protein